MTLMRHRAQLAIEARLSPRTELPELRTDSHGDEAGGLGARRTDLVAADALNEGGLANYT